MAADPGSVWIVRPDMMHVWDEVDGWQAVGPVSIVMPNINGLPTRPGGPQPTDEFWLASAGGAADFKSTITALTGAVFGNITVVENENGISVRVPTARVQICAHLTGAAILNEGDTNSGYRTATQTWNYPQPFSSAPYAVGSPVFAGGHIFGVRLNPPEATQVDFRIYGLVPNAEGRLSVIAIGQY